MHELPGEFSRGQWTYTQVEREGDLAIYRQQHKEGTAQRFELVRIQQLPERKMPNGKMQEAGEYYPVSSQWGTHGWTHFTLAEAQTQASELATRGDEA